MSLIFFGEDLEATAYNHPYADAAKDNFFSYLTDSTTETFEDFEDTPFNHPFDISAGTVHPRGQIREHDDGGVFGRKYIATNDNEDFVLSIDFDPPVAAVGMYVIGNIIHDDNLVLNVSYRDRPAQQYVLLDYPVDTHEVTKGLIFYLGIIDTGNPITDLRFTRRTGHGFNWRFDNITTATADQVDIHRCHSRKVVKSSCGCCDINITINNN